MDIVIGSLLGQVARVMGNELTRNFHIAGYDLTREHWVLLVSLWENGDLTQQELADIGHKNKATITSIINNLEKRELVVRQLNQNDKRNKLIKLTVKGYALEEPLKSIAETTILKLLQGIPQADVAILKTVLIKMLKNTKY